MISTEIHPAPFLTTLVATSDTTLGEFIEYLKTNGYESFDILKLTIPKTLSKEAHEFLLEVLKVGPHEYRQIGVSGDGKEIVV